MKRTPVRGVKENLKPFAAMRSEGRGAARKSRSCLMACLLKNEPASCFVSREVKWFRHGARAKASLKRATSGTEQTRNRVSYP